MWRFFNRRVLIITNLVWIFVMGAVLGNTLIMPTTNKLLFENGSGSEISTKCQKILGTDLNCISYNMQFGTSCAQLEAQGQDCSGCDCPNSNDTTVISNCTCLNGAPGNSCGCKSCNIGYHMTASNQCNLNICGCNVKTGSGATGEKCPEHGKLWCGSCNPGFYSVGRKCLAIPTTTTK